jgi:hypothetical protein
MSRISYLVSEGKHRIPFDLQHRKELTRGYDDLFLRQWKVPQAMFHHESVQPVSVCCSVSNTTEESYTSSNTTPP